MAGLFGTAGGVGPGANDGRARSWKVKSSATNNVDAEKYRHLLTRRLVLEASNINTRNSPTSWCKYCLYVDNQIYYGRICPLIVLSLTIYVEHLITWLATGLDLLQRVVRRSLFDRTAV